jgi:hypothetical protein
MKKYKVTLMVLSEDDKEHVEATCNELLTLESTPENITVEAVTVESVNEDALVS